MMLKIVDSYEGNEHRHDYGIIRQDHYVILLSSLHNIGNIMMNILDHTKADV